MTRTVTIRPATPADAAAIHAAILAMGEHLGLAHKIDSTPADLARHGLAPGRAFEGLIAEIGGEFAGMCLFFRSFSTWRGCPGIYIQDLYVEPRFRGERVGERLVRRAAAQARDRGAGYLRLAVDADNFAAQGFYERLGIAHYEADRIHAAYGEAFEALASGGKDDQGTT
ncbi:GNAT family N-acetyltransferase [Mesorhizobium sp. BAC0120]|uniref:GNAT family N-acetyltransferase n=1 Tax=Mesorhizobium sp. BAC0120 TaxID=3090670 RepID=UPI00298C6C75|nr:GNAT family N-acetyltransferase [Mesorhizobium sp. BAC0120]MDW6021461.1 GNAT family N-acetyltransferase [Mesorhizobium sp. BAC0120]